MNAVGFRIASGVVALLVMGVGVAHAVGPVPAAAGAASDLDFGPQKPAFNWAKAAKAETRKNRKARRAAGGAANVDKKKTGTSNKTGKAAGSAAEAKPAAPKAAAAPKKSPTSSRSGSAKSATTTRPKAPVGGIQLAPIAAAGDAVIGNRTMINCRLQSALPKEVASRNPKVVMADRPSGKVLSLKIVEVDARSGGLLSGSKAMKIEGRLTDKGKIVGTFTARQKSRGSLTSCGILEKAIDEVAAEIGAWLDKPGMNSTLGNDR